MSNPVEEPSTRRKMGYSHFVLEWRIENFSCWMEASHGEAIVCRQSSMVMESAQIELSLYPKGGADRCDPMEMTFAGPNILFREEGDLTFLAPDGVVLCRRRMNEGFVRDLYRVAGPKFRDVVAKIEESEDLHGDHLTIQFKCRLPLGHRIHMKTTLDVLDNSFKITQPNPGLPPARLQPSPGLPPVRFQSNPGLLPVRFQSNPGLLPARLQPSPGLPPVPLQPSPGLLPVRFQPNPGLPPVRLQPSPDSQARIASVSYNGRNGGQQRMLVTYHTVEKSISLKTIPLTVSSANNERPLVQYRLSVFDRSGVLVQHSKAVLNFRGLPNKASVDVSSLESDGHCILRLKIVNGICRSHCCDFFPSTTPFKKPPIQEMGVGEGAIPLSKDLGSFYQDKEFSDFQLKCGDVAFPVHRSILCARSPVFKALLSSDMTEAASGSVVIEDVDPASLDLFLVYLYSGSFEKEVSSDVALKLYYAADKYQVLSLVKECADCLCANVRFSNVCDILALGDRHGDARMTSAARKFILRNFKEVTKSDEWRNYMSTDPQLLVKTVTDFAAEGFVGYICS